MASNFCISRYNSKFALGSLHLITVWIKTHWKEAPSDTEEHIKQLKQRQRRGRPSVLQFLFLLFSLSGAKASPRGAITGTFHSHDNGNQYLLKAATYFLQIGHTQKLQIPLLLYGKYFWFLRSSVLVHC